MVIILFDTSQTHRSFYPLSLTRPVALLRHGILTLKEWWQHVTGLPVFTLSEDYLPADAIPESESYLYIDAAFLPGPNDLHLLNLLSQNESILFKERLVAFCTAEKLCYPIQFSGTDTANRKELDEAHFLHFPWQLFQTNAQTITDHYQLLTDGRTSQPIDATNVITGGTDIFIEPGAVVKGCFINASEGPVYVGKGALVMEGTAIRGPVAICNNAVVKMGAKLYGGTTIGPYCTAGGEIKNAVLTGYSNKAHDGYLGDAVIGEWCNLGAGTTNSNLKNTAGEVKMWSEAAQDFVVVGKKGGLIMGDYSRSAINTGFNTGTVVGACCNVFGNKAPLKHIESFSWGNELYNLKKALNDIDRWKQLKGQQLKEKEKQMLEMLFEM